MSDSNSEITKKLKEASSDLLMPSESEYPFEPFVWSGVSDPLNPTKNFRVNRSSSRFPSRNSKFS